MYEVFSMSKDRNCPFCEWAKDLLKEKELPFQEFVLNKDITRNELLERFPDRSTLPIILKDGQMIGGFSELKNHLSNGV